MLVRLVCPRPLLFCSIALDTPKQKKIVHMVRILLTWLVECGRFRDCMGNNPGLSLRSWQNVLQRWISCWKVAFWCRSTLYQSKTLAISSGVIVAIVRGTSLDARNMSALSAGKRWSNCKRQWSMNGKKTFTLKYSIAVLYGKIAATFLLMRSWIIMRRLSRDLIF